LTTKPRKETRYTKTHSEHIYSSLHSLPPCLHRHHRLARARVGHCCFKRGRWVRARVSRCRGIASGTGVETGPSAGAGVGVGVGTTLPSLITFRPFPNSSFLCAPPPCAVLTFIPLTISPPSPNTSRPGSGFTPPRTVIPSDCEGVILGDDRHKPKCVPDGGDGCGGLLWGSVQFKYCFVRTRLGVLVNKGRLLQVCVEVGVDIILRCQYMREHEVKRTHLALSLVQVPPYAGGLNTVNTQIVEIATTVSIPTICNLTVGIKAKGRRWSQSTTLTGRDAVTTLSTQYLFIQASMLSQKSWRRSRSPSTRVSATSQK
jgi:hypothetical protein